MKGYEAHRFFCLNCGNENLPVYRASSHHRGRFHRKKLWCYYCKQECNNIECYTDEDVELFKEMFTNGEFKEEAEQSIKECN